MGNVLALRLNSTALFLYGDLHRTAGKGAGWGVRYTKKKKEKERKKKKNKLIFRLSFLMQRV